MDGEKKNIMSLVNQEKMNFRKILPKKQTMFIPKQNYMPNTQIIEIVEHFDTFVQLLIQNYLFCDDKEVEIEILNLIDKINLQKNQFVFLNDLRKYDVYLIDLKYGNNSLNTIRHFLLNKLETIKPENKDLDFSLLNFDDKSDIQEAISFQLSPQISVLQSPVLETISLVHQAKQKKLDMERRLLLLKELVPFVRKNHIPFFCDGPRPSPQRPSTVHKFNNVDDRLLLNGLVRFSSKNVPLIQKIFLPHKSHEEIKNRFKNLTRFKSHKNPIKNWKISGIAPLTELEKANLEKGKIWFGEKNYFLIAKYFLPSRSPQFLECNDNNDQKLLIKRGQKYFELPEDDMDSILLDPCFDLYAVNDSVAGKNKEFIGFLKQLYSNGFSDPKLINKDSKEFEATYLTIKLSEKQLSFTNSKNKEMNCYVFNRDNAVNSRIKFKDNKVLFNNSRRQMGLINARHRVIDKGAKRVKREGFEGQVVKRLCPGFKEIEQIAKFVHQREELTKVDKEFYKKLYFN